MATADEDNTTATFILYLPPQLHHVANMSAVQDTNRSQLSEELSRRSALPASNESLQCCVVSAETSACQDNLQSVDDAGVVDTAADCVQVDRAAADDALTESVLTTETGALHCQNVASSKVSDLILSLLTALPYSFSSCMTP